MRPGKLNGLGKKVTPPDGPAILPEGEREPRRFLRAERESGGCQILRSFRRDLHCGAEVVKHERRERSCVGGGARLYL